MRVCGGVCVCGGEGVGVELRYVGCEGVWRCVCVCGGEGVELRYVGCEGV